MMRTPPIVPRGLLTSVVVVLLSILLPTSGALPGPVTAQTAASGREYASVVRTIGSDRLEVRLDDGSLRLVQYIGLRGPIGGSRLVVPATAFHDVLVRGHRVVLEAEGKDREDDYLLRHVYLVDDSSAAADQPLGAAIVAAGWANVVPYPPQYRHRALYLERQQVAMQRQMNLWSANGLGIAAPWHLEGASPSSYVAADPVLWPALDALASIPTGRQIMERLTLLSPMFGTAETEPGVGAWADPLVYWSVVSSEFSDADPRSTATVIAHESSHLLDFAAENDGLVHFGCYALEVRSHRLHARVWEEFFGPGGKPNPKTPWEAAHNRILQFAQKNDIENYVSRSEGYEQNCAGAGFNRLQLRLFPERGSDLPGPYAAATIGIPRRRVLLAGEDLPLRGSFFYRRLSGSSAMLADRGSDERCMVV